MNLSSKIYVAGHEGLVGSAIINELIKLGFNNILGRTRRELDLNILDKVENFFSKEKPEYVFLAAAKVGGIVANNSFPVDFLLSNLKVQNNVIELAFKYKVKRLIFLGSSCIYPNNFDTPISENDLLNGPLELTNRPYALAKIAGIELCKAYNRQMGAKFLAVMPTNLYGFNDNYDLETSHVIPGLISKFYNSKLKNEDVCVWGSGNIRREFLHTVDLAKALLFLMKLDDKKFEQLCNGGKDPLINIGYGDDIYIKDLIKKIKQVSGYEKKIIKDLTKPDGTKRKLLNSNKMKMLGWKPKVNLDKELSNLYKGYEISRGTFIGITGITGTIGKHIKFHLTLMGIPFDSFKGDIRKKSDVEKWLKKNKFTHIIHLASIVSVKQVNKSKKDAYEVNVEGTKNLLNSLNKIKRNCFIFFASTSHVYKSSLQKLTENSSIKPLNFYAETKLAAEEFIEKSDYKNYCIGRLFSVYDENQSSDYLYSNVRKRLEKFNLNHEFKLRGSNNKRDFMRGYDAAKYIILLTLEQFQGIINISSGKSESVLDFVKSKFSIPNIKPLKVNAPSVLSADISKLEKLKQGEIYQIYNNLYL